MRKRSSFIVAWTGGARPAPAPPATVPHGSTSERWPPSDARGAGAQGSCALALMLPAGTQPPPSAGMNAAAPGARKPGSNASGRSARADLTDDQPGRSYNPRAHCGNAPMSTSVASRARPW
jgi:hypothetical protein